MRKYRNINVNMDEKLYTDFHRYRDQTRPVAWIMRELIKKYIEKRKYQEKLKELDQ